LTPLVREAGVDDIPAIHGLIEGAYRGDSARRGWTHEADLLDGQRTDRAELEDIVADPDRVLLILEVGGGIAGCVLVANRGEAAAYLGMLSVDPGRQSAGLGRALLRAAERFAVEAFGATMMEMTVIAARSELIAWYERAGYRRTGETRPFPMSDPRFGLPRTNDLSFVVLARSLP
jgi:ribosomal protein S18 acetylase RimI-like enzyme